MKSATDAVQVLLTHIGEDPGREGLAETPARYLKALEFWTSGYNANPADVLKCFEDGAADVDEMVLQTNLSFWSCCEHHIAAFWGCAVIGYIPNGRIVGLSKLSRLLDIYARRLQVQERLTNQVANALVEHLHPLGVGVVLYARHSCMESRGVQKTGTITMTSALRGAIKDKPEARAEFMAFVSASMQGRVL